MAGEQASDVRVSKRHQALGSPSVNNRQDTCLLRGGEGLSAAASRWCLMKRATVGTALGSWVDDRTSAELRQNASGDGLAKSRWSGDSRLRGLDWDTPRGLERSTRTTAASRPDKRVLCRQSPQATLAFALDHSRNIDASLHSSQLSLST